MILNKLIVGNWKLNPPSLNDAVALALGVSMSIGAADFDHMILLPPFIFLEELAKNFKQIKWGAQDVFWERKGAFAGGVSLETLKSVGVGWVLVGHSDRRRFFGETDEIVNKKARSAFEQEFKVIVSVGELQRGDDISEVSKSFRNSVSGFKSQDLCNLVIAYEPVWAIGTGEFDDPARSNQVLGQLKQAADKIFGLESGQIKFLYGGSVTSSNSRYFLSQSNIDGVLVGGASLDPGDFSAIVKMAV